MCRRQSRERCCHLSSGLGSRRHLLFPERMVPTADEPACVPVPGEATCQKLMVGFAGPDPKGLDSAVPLSGRI